jgi:hypothetical protein
LKTALLEIIGKLASKIVAWVGVVSRGAKRGEVVRRRGHVYDRGARAVYEHSDKARAPHTNGPRDVPWCGAQSLLQKPLHCRWEFEKLVLNIFVVIFGPVFARAYGSRGRSG